MNWRFDSPPTAAVPSPRWPALPIAIALGLLPLTQIPAGAEDLIPLPRTGLYRIVPERVRFPDGYKVDVHRDPSRFAEPVDSDTIAEMRFWSPPASGMSMSLGLEDESKRIGSGGTLMHVFFEWKF